MNYEESLARLEKEKKRLEDANKITDFSGEEKFVWNEDDKTKWELIKELIPKYSRSLAGEVDDDKVERVFGEVYGFTEQKEEIKTLLLTQKYLKAKGIKTPEKGKILCFVGSPGVGKTYFAGKFAEALGRGFFRINLGGTSSAVIITGGKKLWRGSEPGGIIDAILNTESCDPVVLLDEVEKAGDDPHHGNITNDLLHVLDPEQNQHFTDQFLNVGIDISRITFILTANEIEKISEPLKNRLRIVKVEDYNESEKIMIGRITIERIFREDYEDNNKDLFEMSDEAFHSLITKSKESGVRQLESKIKSIIEWCFSEWTRQLERGGEEEKIIIDENKIYELFPGDSEENKEKDDEETKLREKKRRVRKREENRLQLFKPLEFSENKDYCPQHQKNTLQTSQKLCVLCQLEAKTKQFIAVIDKENYETMEKIWQEQKEEWVEQSKKLQSGSEEQKALSQKIKSSIKNIDKKFAAVRKVWSGRANSQNKSIGENLPWIIGGGIILILLGCFFGWIFARKQKKKKNKVNWLTFFIKSVSNCDYY